MNDKYRVLRAQLKKRGIDTKYLAEKLDISTSTTSKRMRGDAAWLQTDMYTIMDLLHLPYEKIPVVFPRGGMYAGELNLEEEKSPEVLLAEAVRLVARGKTRTGA